MPTVIAPFGNAATERHRWTHPLLDYRARAKQTSRARCETWYRLSTDGQTDNTSTSDQTGDGPQARRLNHLRPDRALRETTVGVATND